MNEHRCWPWYVRSAVMLACSIVVVFGIVATGALYPIHAHRPALVFCLDETVVFGNGCWSR